MKAKEVRKRSEGERASETSLERNCKNDGVGKVGASERASERGTKEKSQWRGGRTRRTRR